MGGSLGVKWAGSILEAGEESVGSGILKVAETRRNRKFCLQDCAIFFDRKSTEAGTITEGARAGITRFKKIMTTLKKHDQICMVKFPRDA